MRVHLGNGTVYLREWINVDLAESGSALASDQPSYVEKWGTTEDDYYGRMNSARRKAVQMNLPVDHSDTVCDRYGSWDNLPFHDGEVETILSRQVFEHLSLREAKAGLMEARRVLKPDGEMILSVPDTEATLELYRSTGDSFFKRHLFGSRKCASAYHQMGYTKKSLAALLDEHGFDFVNWCEHPHFYPAIEGRFRKRADERLDTESVKPWEAPWQYCGDPPGTELTIPDGWRALDVGPGPFPWPRANEYLDVSEEYLTALPSEQRIVADIHDLGLGDKSYDFVYASHVFEHLDDPVKAAAELSRVAKSGVVVTPSPFIEALFMFHEDDHKWWVLPRGDRLLFIAVDRELTRAVADRDAESVMHKLLRLGCHRYGDDGLHMRKWWRASEPHLDVIHRWEGELKVEVIE